MEIIANLVLVGSQRDFIQQLASNLPRSSRNVSPIMTPSIYRRPVVSTHGAVAIGEALPNLSPILDRQMQ